MGKGLAVFLIFMGAVSAWAAPKPVVTYDQNGMPRCLEIPGDTTSYGLVFFWKNSDPYHRDITAIKIDPDLVSQLEFPKGAKATMILNTHFDLDCRDWAKLTQFRDQLAGMRAVSSQMHSLDEYQFDSQIRLALREIENGSNEFLANPDAQAFLRTNPIPDYTVEINRNLTLRFGAGFSADVFKAWVLSHPQNARFQKQISASLKQAPDSLANLFLHRRLVFVRGLGHEMKSYSRFLVLENEIRALGIPMDVVDTRSYDAVQINAEKVRDVIEADLSAGNNVIVVGLSKGATEAVLALSEMHAHPTSLVNHVEAMISLSGVFAPSFLLDWATHYPQWLVAYQILVKMYSDSGVTMETDQGFFDLNVPNMLAYQQQIAINGLPQNVFYINMVGALTGTGLAKDPQIRELQDGIVRGELSGYGANDGYVEYPGTLFPPSWGIKSHELIVDSSHTLLDGTFEGQSIDSDTAVRNLIASMIQSAL